MNYQHLLFGVDDDGVATVTIHRPDKLNALNRAVVDELDACFAHIATDASVRAVILTGSGQKAFVAGADIGEFVMLDKESGQKLARHGQDVFTRIESSTKPVVAAVNGFALGGGCELAMACHLRVAADTARFGQPEVGLGLIPGYGGTQRLPRLVGRGIATELILTGAQIGADRAYQIGLVNRVVDPDSLLEEARALVLTIADKAPVAVQCSLEALSASDGDLAAGLRVEAKLFGSACATADFKEGVDAFLHRRAPSFMGR